MFYILLHRFCIANIKVLYFNVSGQNFVNRKSQQQLPQSRGFFHSLSGFGAAADNVSVNDPDDEYEQETQGVTR